VAVDPSQQQQGGEQQRHPDAALDPGEPAGAPHEVAASSGVVVGADGGNTVADGAVQPETGKLAEPALDHCPSCKQGLLYVIAFDPDATHEAGQALYAPRKLSGGSAHRKCFFCEYGDTVALNPSTAPQRPVL
jgi:hypothetical protein